MNGGRARRHAWPALCVPCLRATCGIQACINRTTAAPSAALTALTSLHSEPPMRAYCKIVCFTCVLSDSVVVVAVGTRGRAGRVLSAHGQHTARTTLDALEPYPLYTVERGWAMSHES